jgi:carbon-monoxide dehydrogenase medium subunit
MKPAPFSYHCPETLSEALGLLASLEEARPLAGGQSLIPMMNFRFVQPSAIVDLNRIVELVGLRCDAASISFGAMTRQRDILRSAAIRETMPVISAALAHVGHRQTRARGTIGGSLAHFDPSAELANLACLLDCEFEVRSKRGRRALSFADYARGYMSTALAPYELLTSLRFCVWPATHGYAFEEFSLRRGDFAIAATSCLVQLGRDGCVARAAIAVSGVSPVPQRLASVEAAMVGCRPEAVLCREAAQAAGSLDAMSDAYVPSSYRTQLASTMTYRAVQQALDHAAGGHAS